MSLFNLGDYTLHSGEKSNFKIDCDFLTDEDLESLAKICSKNLHFKQVIGIPEGGLRFAKALEKYCNPISDVILLVDDVVTTGTSMEEYRARLREEGVEEYIAGLTIFSRNTFAPVWIYSIFAPNYLVKF